MHEYVTGGHGTPQVALALEQGHVPWWTSHASRMADGDESAGSVHAARGIPSSSGHVGDDGIHGWVHGHEPVDKEIVQPLNATCVACMVLLMLVGLAVGALQMI